MLTLSISIAVFILLSGLMAGIDAAVLSVTQPEIEEMARDARRGAVWLQQLRRQLPRSVVVIVIATNTINVLGPIFVSRLAFEQHGTGVLGAITVGLALGTIVFSEIIPKAVGTHYSPLIARLSAAPLLALGYALFPLVVALAWLSKLFTRGSRSIGTEQQIRALALMGRRAGHIESDEVQMIYRTFLLNDRSARDIMTPLSDVVSVQADHTIPRAAEEVRRYEYSRYPVFGTSSDDVQGLVRSHDILDALAAEREDESVSMIARPGLTVDANTKSDDLLVIFRDAHVHLAVVRDGERTVGIVTLEDVLEELVGEIEDEKDVLTLRGQL